MAKTKTSKPTKKTSKPKSTPNPRSNQTGVRTLATIASFVGGFSIGLLGAHLGTEHGMDDSGGRLGYLFTAGACGYLASRLKKPNIVDFVLNIGAAELGYIVGYAFNTR